MINETKMGLFGFVSMVFENGTFILFVFVINVQINSNLIIMV